MDIWIERGSRLPLSLVHTPTLMAPANSRNYAVPDPSSQKSYNESDTYENRLEITKCLQIAIGHVSPHIYWFNYAIIAQSTPEGLTFYHTGSTWYTRVRNTQSDNNVYETFKMR